MRGVKFLSDEMEVPSLFSAGNRGKRSCCRVVYQKGMATHKERLLDSAGPRTNWVEMVMNTDMENWKFLSIMFLDDIPEDVKGSV